MANLIQSLNRTVHVSNSGIDVERRFYIEPYSYHPEVLKALMGSVTAVKKEWKRVPPARDPWIPNCYCSEAMVTLADVDAMTSSPGLDEDGDNDTLLKRLENVREAPADGSVGAFVHAHYRPLITAWQSDSASDVHPEFDWMDYQSTPGVRQMPWPEGLYVFHSGLSAQVPDTVGFPFTVPVATLTVRRMLLPEIPWDKIDAAAGCVNNKTFPPDNSNVSARIPSCPARTLKFENAQVTNQIDTEGNRWYEVTYTFTRINHYERHLISIIGDDNPGPVTWNHIFLRPSCFGWKGATGWYECFKGEAVPIWNGPFGIDRPGMALQHGRLHSECDFMLLFTP
ncbi:MAG: hypothetical protein KKA42_03335 [candidate division Zixibacteria bacterium]|nr:hypothetical protein [candidate division Zixibacteria bacterium]